MGSRGVWSFIKGAAVGGGLATVALAILIATLCVCDNVALREVDRCAAHVETVVLIDRSVSRVVPCFLDLLDCRFLRACRR